MRIALLLYGSLERLSGGYLYDRMLVHALRAAGHTVEVLALPWRNYPAHLADNLAPAWRRRLLQADVDLFLQDELNHPSLAWLNRALRKAHHAPIVALVHHLRSDEPHPAPLLPLYRGVERAYLRSCDGYLCNSRTTLAAVARLLGRPPAALQSHVAYPGGDHIAYPGGDHIAAPAPAAGDVGGVGPVRTSFPSLHEDRAAVLFVGTLLPRKQVHTLIDAVARSPRAVTLTIVGSDQADPTYALRLRRQVEELGLGARVAFAGVLSDVELHACYAAADLLAVPSFEGFGIVYLEAMAHGLPVIASTAGAAHEIVTQGENGFLVAPGDSAALAAHLATFAADPALRTHMRAAARARFAAQPAWSASGAAAAAWLAGVTRRTD